MMEYERRPDSTIKRKESYRESDQSGRFTAKCRQPGAAAAQFAQWSLRLSGRAERVFKLARRAARLAGNLCAVQSVVPYDRYVRSGPGCAEAVAKPGRQ